MADIKNSFIEKLVEKINLKLPQGVSDFQDDFKAQLRTIITKVLNECQIVTQEEFTAYVKALERTQKKIKTLERKLAELEQLLNKK